MCGWNGLLTATIALATVWPWLLLFALFRPVLRSRRSGFTD